MREPVSREASGEGVSGAVGDASRRLDLAVSRLHASLNERAAAPVAAPTPDLDATRGEVEAAQRHAAQAEAALEVAQAQRHELQQERDGLAAELKALRVREHALEAAAAAASLALGRAAAEVRMSLSETTGEEEAA